MKRGHIIECVCVCVCVCFLIFREPIINEKVGILKRRLGQKLIFLNFRRGLFYKIFRYLDVRR